MARTITNHMLRKKIGYVNRQNSPSSISSNTTGVTGGDEAGGITLETHTITGVRGDVLITQEGVESRMYSPMPCLFWKCLTPPDEKGVSTLKNKLEGLFLNDGASLYCLGVSGASDEFEVRMQVGTNEVRLNNSFLNLNAGHLVVNGLEKKEE